MGLKNFTIELDNPSGLYYAGSTVSGRVLLSLDTPKKIRALNLLLQGRAKVRWTHTTKSRRSDGSTRDETTFYTSDESYFSNNFRLLGEQEIPAGEHMFAFTSVLPQSLPSSFKGLFGFIKYNVKATIDRPWKFDHKTKTPFSVTTPIDLNFNNTAMQAVQKVEQKSFCCMWCKSGPLQLVVRIPQTGYVAGQPIPLTIEVDNASNVEVNSVVCKLKKELKFIASSPRYKERNLSEDINTLTLAGVRPHGSNSWTENLFVPEMPFVNLDPCSIINLTYKLKVELCTGAFHLNPHVSIPIIIGSVPIYQNNYLNPIGDRMSYQYLAPSAPTLDYGLPNSSAFGLSEKVD